MALFTPSQSPAVVVKEIDLTGGVPNVQTSTGAIVGHFRWGPIRERTLVTNEAELIETFGTPDSTNTIDFHNAAYFLRYSNKLQVVRETSGSASNAFGATFQSASSTATKNSVLKIYNEAGFAAAKDSLDSMGIIGMARFPGSLGKSLQISTCPQSTADSAFDGWAYKTSFDGPPGSSVLDSARGGTNTEIHIAVVDRLGLLTGTKGTVLETYPYVSVAPNSLNADGTNNFALDVVNEKSNYVYLVGFDSAFTSNVNLAESPLSLDSTGKGRTYMSGINGVGNLNLTAGGADDSASSMDSTAQYLTGFDLFEDKEAVEVDFLIAPSLTTKTKHNTVVNDLVSTAAGIRKDCVVVASPARNDVVGVTSEATATTNITTTAAGHTKSSYLIMDGNFLKVYDKFNDKFIEIPAASSTAGIMAATDRTAAPWFSPAGTKRGQYFGVTSINYNPNKARRDELYKAGINPIVNIQGSGVVLFGDKTALQRPSAFDRINVRRLFLVLERAIAKAAENVLFEFNDEFTRAEFVNIIEPVLRDVKGRRGITDFRVLADETVNTPAVIDRNEFIANIFIKPARSINYVTLNFVAVRTGVSFEEVVGTV